MQLIVAKDLHYLIAVDKVLCGEKFRKLKRVDVSLETRSVRVQNGSIVEGIKTFFPNMEARGILRVVEARGEQMP